MEVHDSTTLSLDIPSVFRVVPRKTFRTADADEAPKMGWQYPCGLGNRLILNHIFFLAHEKSMLRVHEGVGKISPFYVFAIGLLVEWSPLIPNGIDHVWRSTSSNNYGWSRLWPLAIKVAQPKNFPTSWKQHCMVWISQHLTKFML